MLPQTQQHINWTATNSYNRVLCWELLRHMDHKKQLWPKSTSHSRSCWRKRTCRCPWSPTSMPCRSAVPRRQFLRHHPNCCCRPRHNVVGVRRDAVTNNLQELQTCVLYTWVSYTVAVTSLCACHCKMLQIHSLPQIPLMHFPPLHYRADISTPTFSAPPPKTLCLLNAGKVSKLIPDPGSVPKFNRMFLNCPKAYTLSKISWTFTYNILSNPINI